MTAIPIESVAELTTVTTTSAVIHAGSQVRRYDGLTPDTDHEIDGFAFRTLPVPGELLCTFATVNDVHFGEQVCGLVEGHPEVQPVLRSEPGEPPYPQTMNRGAVAEMVDLEPVVVLVKGDLTSDGTPEQFQEYRDVYGTAFGDRLVQVRGNHESYHDLAMADTPVQYVDVPGARLVLLDTSASQVEYGTLDSDQLDELRTVVAEAAGPVLLFGHHHVWNPGSRERPERYFGLRPDDSEALVALAAEFPNVLGYFAGHTHRNRVRRFAPTGSMPWVEVSAVKDYPGVWAEYRVHEGGVLQIVHRISAPEALAWTERTRDMFAGLYAGYAFGSLSDRCFAITARET